MCRVIRDRSGVVVFKLIIGVQLTLYPYLAMILAAIPRPPFGGPRDGLESPPVGLGLEVSVREGGGAIAAPPDVAVE